MIFRYEITKQIKVIDFLKQQNIPANVITALKSKGQILVNDQGVTTIYEMLPRDILEIVFPLSNQGENIKSVKGDLDIIYEDSYLLLINKPNNLATIPTKKHYHHSLANYVMSYYKRKGIVANIHFVSRLDMGTSGLILLAKNPYVLTLLKDSIYEKHYLLEIKGHLRAKNGIIETGIEKAPDSIIKRRISNSFINSKTLYSVYEEKESTSIVDATLITGKTHQLRLHFSYLQHPIIGDVLYNDDEQDNNAILHLHSYKISFYHPILKQKMEFVNYPQWLKK